VKLLDFIRSRRRRRRDPTEVFTPKSVVTREMFERRNEPDLAGRPGLQDRLQKALRDPGGQILVYGDTGVGKSSLLKYAAEDEDRSYVSIECFSERSYEQIIEECIGRLIDFKEVTYSDTHTTESQLELSVSPAKLMSAKGTTKEAYGRTRTFTAIQKEPVEVLLDAMHLTDKTLIVLDNFQNVDDDRARKLVAQTMERLSDRSKETDDTKLVIIGIAEDAPSLLQGSGSFTRRTTEVGVPRMPDDEIRGIFETGFHLLGLKADDNVLERLVFYSDGFPYFAHLLGQTAAEAARRADAASIDRTMIELALRDASEQVEQNYSVRVAKALEKGGDTQPRRRILELLAYDDAQEWSSSDVIKLFAAKYGDREQWSFLHAALAGLTNETHGAVLKRSGTQGTYIYKFRDPHLRPYLRLSTFPRLNGD
jgi:Cdc6-like AAA superfamily ATPase